LKRFLFALFLLLIAGAGLVHAQGNYEIQVYGSETQPPKSMMVELHSNFTADGQRQLVNGVVPTYRQEHETLELTQGIND